MSPRSSSKRPLAVLPLPPALVAVCRIKVRATRTIGTADDSNRMWPVSTFRYFSDEVYLLCRPRTYDITYLELQT